MKPPYCASMTYFSMKGKKSSKRLFRYSARSAGRFKGEAFFWVMGVVAIADAPSND
jgi:hypothetical protein